MANPVIINNDHGNLRVRNPKYTNGIITFGAAETYDEGLVMGQVAVISPTTGAADGGNTGDGTVTGVALAAGGPAKVGAFVLTCTSIGGSGTPVAAAMTADGGNTGDGVVSVAAVAGTAAKVGTYTLTCLVAVANAGRFEVVDPQGNRLQDLNIAIAYDTDHFDVTIADGAADFIVGDIFTLAITIPHAAVFSLADPDGIVVKDDITLPGTAGGTVTPIIAGLTFILTDGATDFIVGDFFTITTTIGAENYVPFSVTAVDGSEIPRGIIPTAVTSIGAGNKRYRLMIAGEIDEASLIFEGDVLDDSMRRQLRAVGILPVEGLVLDILDNQ